MDYYKQLADQLLSNEKIKVNGSIIFVWNEYNTKIEEIRIVNIDNLTVDINKQYEVFISTT